MFQFFSVNKNLIMPPQSEIKRYLGYKKSDLVDDITQKEINCCIDEIVQVAAPNSVYENFPLELFQKNKIKFADVEFSSADLYSNLIGFSSTDKPCTKIVLLAATIGVQVDFLIRRYQQKDCVKAAIMQAVAASFIEEYVDLLNKKIKDDSNILGEKTRARFSPGFGDVSLQLQKDFFRILPCSKIGLTLMDTLIMAPEKSVTAFIGIQEN
jgi:hypothetical protein